MKHVNLKSFVSLHLLFVLYSLTDLFGKMAASYAFDDVRFYLLYAAVLAVLFLYAIGWQQVIKRLPLTTAFSNRAITVFWGRVWGVIFFQEELNVLKVLGAAIVGAGVMLYSRADAADADQPEPAKEAVDHALR